MYFFSSPPQPSSRTRPDRIRQPLRLLFLQLVYECRQQQNFAVTSKRPVWYIFFFFGLHFFFFSSRALLCRERTASSTTHLQSHCSGWQPCQQSRRSTANVAAIPLHYRGISRYLHCNFVLMSFFASIANAGSIGLVRCRRCLPECTGGRLVLAAVKRTHRSSWRDASTLLS